MTPAGSKEVTDYTWKVIPGRRVSHALVSFSNGSFGTLCGQTKGYLLDGYTEPGKYTAECEQCLIALVTGIRRHFWKMMLGHVPIEVKVKIRKKWREYLRFQRTLNHV